MPLKKLLLKQIFLTLIFTTFMLQSLFSQGKSTVNVAVMDFSGKGMAIQEASMLADSFRSFLVSTGAFTVLNRANMDVLLKEQGFQQSGCTDTACAVELGKLLNMHYMFTGTASKFGETWMITIEMINIETSQISSSKIKTVKGEMDALLMLTKDIADEFAADLRGKPSPTANTTAQGSSNPTKQKPAKSSSDNRKATPTTSSDGEKDSLLLPSVSLLTLGAASMSVSLFANKQAADAHYIYSSTDPKSTLQWNYEASKFEGAERIRDLSRYAAIGLAGSGAILLAIDLASKNINLPKSSKFLLPTTLLGASAITGVLTLAFNNQAKYANDLYDVDTEAIAKSATVPTEADWNNMWGEVERSQNLKNGFGIATIATGAAGITTLVLALVKDKRTASIFDNLNFGVAYFGDSYKVNCTYKF